MGEDICRPYGGSGKESACNVGDLGSIPGSGRSPGGGNGNPLQYSCQENPMDSGAWCPWGGKESDTTERLHFHHTRWGSQVALMVQNLPANTGEIRDMGLIPELGRSPGGHGNPL